MSPGSCEFFLDAIRPEAECPNFERNNRNCVSQTVQGTFYPLTRKLLNPVCSEAMTICHECCEFKSSVSNLF